MAFSNDQLRIIKLISMAGGEVLRILESSDLLVIPKRPLKKFFTARSMTANNSLGLSQYLRDKKPQTMTV